VTEARDWMEGVYMAATMGSETTAAMVGGNGAVRRDPFAMLPFCGYHMGEYFRHWLDMERRLEMSGHTLPRIFCVNWFRKDADGRFVWPGYGENMRVLAWVLERVAGRGGAQEHSFGLSPRFEDLAWEGLPFTRERYAQVIATDASAWRDELKLHDELFAQLGARLPPALAQVRARFAARLAT
jgi:phosphoenolpyruvate carboxykinase (GTP)